MVDLRSGGPLPFVNRPQQHAPGFQFYARAGCVQKVISDDTIRSLKDTDAVLTQDDDA